MIDKDFDSIFILCSGLVDIDLNVIFDSVTVGLIAKVISFKWSLFVIRC